MKFFSRRRLIVATAIAVGLSGTVVTTASAMVPPRTKTYCSYSPPPRHDVVSYKPFKYCPPRWVPKPKPLPTPITISPIEKPGKPAPYPGDGTFHCLAIDHCRPPLK